MIVERVDPSGPAARACLARYYAELDQRFEGGFDALKSSVADAGEFAPPSGSFLVGTLDGVPVACGAVKLVLPEVAYVKRMWVDGERRGMGLGRGMLLALENEARIMGCRTVQLETHRELTEAIALYRKAGYEEVAPFNDEYYAHHWFQKGLAAAP
jgi:ribosomal protein S18 acetylase RimI-like enzyme